MNNARRLPVRTDAMPSLAMVLSGDTCYPVSLANFEAYLIHKEHSIELLQFIVWFQDYRKRFLKLPAAAQAASPGRSHFVFSIPTPARTAERVRASKARADAIRYADGASLGSTASNHTMLPQPGARTRHVAVDDTAPAQADYNSSMHSHGSRTGMYAPSAVESSTSRADLMHMPQATSGYMRPCDQPFRAECMRILATFLKLGAVKELPLDSEVRETAIRDLAWNTHPDVFLPVYEEVYFILDTISLPRFLTAASANINRPKQLLCCIFGVLATAMGFLIAILLIALVPIPPAANRAWRLFAVVPASVGLSSIYSAYRGFCSRAWVRSATQLHEWELEEMDDTCARCNRHRPVDPRPPSPSSTATSYGTGYMHSWQSDNCETVVVSDSICCNSNRTRTQSRSLFTRYIRSCTLPVDMDAEKARVATYGGKRSPYFGPEKVVLDPRIRALHNMVMRDLACFFIVVTLAFSALVFSVPNRRS